MPRFVADEGFRRSIVTGLRYRIPSMDLVLAQDVGLSQTPDPDILEWAALENRIVLTHDINTMVGDANARLMASLPMPGVVVVHWDTPPGRVIQDLLEMIVAGVVGDWENQIRYIERR